MSGSSKSNLLYDCEIEKTAKKLRKEAKARKLLDLLDSQSDLAVRTEQLVEKKPGAVAADEVLFAQTDHDSETKADCEEETDSISVASTESDMADDPRLFRRLVDSCPNHKFSEGDLLQYFYQGMTVDTKNLVNSASGGGFSQNTMSEAKRLIQHLVEAMREYEEPRIQLLKKAAQASSSDFEAKFEERIGRMERLLNTVVEKVASAGQPMEKPCGACGNLGHTSLQCTGGGEEYQAQANSSHNFYSCIEPLLSLPKRDQYPEPKQPPTMQQPQQKNYRPPHQRMGYQAPPVPQPVQEKQGKSLEEMMAELIGNQQFLQDNVQQLQQSQAEQKVQIEGLARQVSQLATSVNQLKGHQGKLPSQVQLNPRENISMITLRSGKELNEPTIQNTMSGLSKDFGAESQLQQSENYGEEIDSAAQNTDTSGLAKQNGNPTAVQKGKEAEHKLVEGEQSKVHTPSSLHDPEIEIPVPFPRRLAKKKPEEDLIDFMKIFGKLEINLPFLQTLKLPQLSKFLKDFIVGMSKKSGKIVMSENVSAVIRKELPPKCKDPDTRVVIQLADGSCVHPEGLLENVLVSVNNFIYPADFYVVRMSGVQSKGSSGVLLSRPFLRTAKSIIDVSNGTICLDYHGEKYTFSIDDAMKTPNDAENAYSIDVTDPFVQEHLETKSVQDKFLHVDPKLAGSGHTVTPQFLK
ncbi:uncharacterized protein LOC131025664 [Salvia miltiorrhiza]|uniref:uncharacterized protein LOC131025664 n=1 Tax=Salvia miltiorrhiza TaxID=226208 RepID=UPI0025AC21A8|nr:uncharacterized protein LOC131025664 [Salvia miltiorrhiza]